MAHNPKPPKPAGQGGVAPAWVQPVNPWESAVMNTDGLEGPHSPAGGWEDHDARQNPGGFGGSR